MRKLIMGIVEFRGKMLPQYAEQLSKLALAQTPPTTRRFASNTKARSTTG
ncbi:hypothetical protein LMG28727_07396 [Paraburkholderia kirstenboschensis]|nr:hypothetical protein [Paraburkholderia kirstenboschensis]CAD6561319.1 hypothetical protein LMG28727_07396 [Paraburkholderia kirstenboschensis]